MTPPRTTTPTQNQNYKRKYLPEDADQAIVQTPYGRGLVVRTRRADNIKEIQLLEWESFAKKVSSPPPEPFMLYTPVEYPSVTPHIGDDVICQYGRGRITAISIVDMSPDKENKDCDKNSNTNTSSNDNGATPTQSPLKSSEPPQKSKPTPNQKPILKYTIALTSWRLSQTRKPIHVHLITPPPRVVRKHTLNEMDAHSRVSFAQHQKTLANAQFSKQKDYALALITYAGAVDAVRNVQHDHSSNNYVRADLVVVMVTCSNNAGMCCVHLKKWEEGRKFAQNALILLDALYQKRGRNIHGILNGEGLIDAKLFGEWRVKSYFIVGRCCLEKGEEDVASGVLKKGLEVGKVYLEEMGTEGCKCKSNLEKASYKSLLGQVKEIRKLMAECVERKKREKKMEKKRAVAMFGKGASKHAEIGSENVAKTGSLSTIKNNTEATKAEKSTEKQNLPLESAPNTKIDLHSLPKQDNSIFKTSSFDGKSNSKRDTSNGDKPSPFKKKVSFSRHPPEIKEFEKDNDDGLVEELPWYAEHKEALIMMGIAGFSALALLGLRRTVR